MRATTIAALAALSLAGGVSGAGACGGSGDVCDPSVVAWPAYTEAGQHIGVVEARVRPWPHLEISRFSGQPITVLYNNPGSAPGSVDPYMHLVPLPHVRRSTTLGAYPAGY